MSALPDRKEITNVSEERGEAPLILGIDTSGRSASAALCRENKILAEIAAVTKLTHSQVIMPICEEVLKSAGVSLSEVDIIAAAKGPGSYTGLRIGISAVKAMCFALDKKCAGVSALEALAYNFAGLQGFEGIICAVMPARGELYYNADFKLCGGKLTRLCSDRIIAASDLAEELRSRDGHTYIAGDCAEEFCEKYIADKNIFPAPPQMRTLRASNLCFAALGSGEFITAEELNAEYLQETKAEKELKEKLNGTNVGGLSPVKGV